MRAAATIRLLEEGGADLYKLFQLRDDEKKDYAQLGLPAQGAAIVLKSKGIIQKRGIQIHYEKSDGKRRNTSRRTMWSQGCYFGALLDEFIKIMIKEDKAIAMHMQSRQEVAISA